jgi:hypothetical protein
VGGEVTSHESALAFAERSLTESFVNDSDLADIESEGAGCIGREDWV